MGLRPSSRSMGFKALGAMRGYIIDIGGVPLRRIMRKLQRQNRPAPELLEKVLGPYRMDAGDFRNSNAGQRSIWT